MATRDVLVNGGCQVRVQDVGKMARVGRAGRGRARGSPCCTRSRIHLKYVVKA